MQNIYVFMFIKGGKHKVIGFLLILLIYWWYMEILVASVMLFVYFKWCFKAYFSLVVF